MKITKKNIRELVIAHIAKLLEDNDRFKNLPGYEEYEDGEKLTRRRNNPPKDEVPDETDREDDPIFRSHLEESVPTDDVIQHFTAGVRGAVFDTLEEMSADAHVVELLSRAGEMSPEAEAVNAAILSGVRKGTEDYKNKMHHPLGGIKPVQAVAEGEEDDLAEREAAKKKRK